ncbi:MAG TPA: FAD-dependent oxidoreductase [Thermoanaerobaculia bacterium]
MRDLSEGLPISELTAEGTAVGRLGDDEILVVRRGAEYFAVGAHCTHYHAPLVEGLADDATIRCPWHHACFNLRTGAVLAAPALSPLPAWRIEVRGDRLFIGEKIRVETRAKRGPANVVIVGAGAAGLNVATTLRTEGYEGPIVLVSADDDLPYDKPNLSKDFLAGSAPAEWIPLRTRSDYEDQRIDLRLGEAVVSVDTTTKRITLSSGERLSFDALVLAMGAEPRRLSIPGAERLLYLRTWRDAREIMDRANGARRVAVVGSSFIGLEVAASLRQRGLEVAVASQDRVPLERVLGSELGKHIQTIHERHGVQFHLGRDIAAVDVSGVILADGTRLDADLVVAGVGVTPAIELAKSAGLEIENGVVVNEFLETSVRGVYACGDIAAFPDARSGQRIRVEHWVVAGRQGQTVARNLLGAREPYTAPPFFWSAHYDMTISYVGYARGWDAVDIDGSLEANDATVTYRRGRDVLAIATIGRDRVSLEAERQLLSEFSAVR